MVSTALPLPPAAVCSALVNTLNWSVLCALGMCLGDMGTGGKEKLTSKSALHNPIFPLTSAGVVDG